MVTTSWRRFIKFITNTRFTISFYGNYYNAHFNEYYYPQKLITMQNRRAIKASPPANPPLPSSAAAGCYDYRIYSYFALQKECHNAQKSLKKRTLTPYLKNSQKLIPCL
jgi:hypothetical protein